MTRYKITYRDGSEQAVNRNEYAVSLIKLGSPVRWRTIKLDGSTIEGTGILVRTWMCQDVVCADIDVDGAHIGVLLFQAARVWRLRDVSQLPSIGSGI